MLMLFGMPIMLMLLFGFAVTNDVRNVLKKNWKLEPQNNPLAYVRYDIDYSGSFYQNNSVGRYFNISRNFILQKYVDLLS